MEIEGLYRSNHDRSSHGCSNYDRSSGFALSGSKFNVTFNQPQSKDLGAIAAKPEVFQGFVPGMEIERVEAKEPSPIHAHQRFRALRVGTLRDHESVAAAALYFDVDAPLYAARNREHLHNIGSGLSRVL